MTRETVAGAARLGRSASARGTAKKVNDDNLMQTADVDMHFSETHTEIERPQPIGLTSVPLKQKEEQGGQQKQQQGSDGDQFNYSQPKGEAWEPFVHYIEGNHSHPVVVAGDDRRVRPYGMKEGRGANYAPDGSEQMVYFKQDGAYLISLDGKSVQNPNGNETRMASLRHVNKDMQTHRIEQKQQGQGGQQQQQEEYKHEGKSVNTEVRCIKDRIEFRAGTKVVGYYEVSSDTWYFTGKLIHNVATEKLKDEAPTHERSGDHITDTASKIDHN